VFLKRNLQIQLVFVKKKIFFFHRIDRISDELVKLVIQKDQPGDTKNYRIDRISDEPSDQSGDTNGSIRIRFFSDGLTGLTG